MLEITWLGTATVKIRSEESAILIDPYAQPFVKGDHPVNDHDLQNTDAVFITHPHLDHFGDIDVFLKKLSCPFYVCERGKTIAENAHFPITKLRTIHAGQIMQIGNLAVRVHQGIHCSLDSSLAAGVLARCNTPRKVYNALKMMWMQLYSFRIGEKDIFTYEITDGSSSILLMGSAGYYAEDTGNLSPDLLVLPFQGKKDMNSYGKSILSHYAPGKVMLTHFDDAFPPLTQEMDTEGFMKYMKEGREELQIFTPEKGKWYQV